MYNCFIKIKKGNKYVYFKLNIEPKASIGKAKVIVDHTARMIVIKEGMDPKNASVYDYHNPIAEGKAHQSYFKHSRCPFQQSRCPH